MAEHKNDSDEMDKKLECDQKSGPRLTRDKLRNKGQQQWTPYDIWEDDEQTAVAKLKRSKRTKYVPNLLPAVMPPPEGMSYNPPVDSYLRMTEQMEKEEQRIEKKRRRMERRVGIGTAEAMALPALREDVQYSFKRGGVQTDDEVKDEVAEDDGEDTKVNAKESQPKKAKTAKAKVRRKLREEEEKKKITKKELVVRMRRQLDSLKSLKSEVLKETEANEKHKILKKRQRALKALTGRKRLGRGKFHPFVEPVLTVAELPASLRQLCPQGNVLEERLKSFQRRNILPIAGERLRNNLKPRLKSKLVEKRSVREVNEESRVI